MYDAAHSLFVAFLYLTCPSGVFAFVYLFIIGQAEKSGCLVVLAFGSKLMALNKQGFRQNFPLFYNP